MTETPEGIGKRIAHYRRAIGITAKELAIAVDSERVTEAIIQNIESGRKTDLAVSQLLSIARGLEVSPVLLLASMDRPFDALDLVGLSPAVAKLSNEALDAWISATGSETVDNLSYRGLITQTARADLRKLLKDYNDWVIFEEHFETYKSEFSPADIEDEIALHKAREVRIKALCARVSEVFDVSWAKGPWSSDG